jgi:zinc D-Ala-D-Ala carboxypeptidase
MNWKDYDPYFSEDEFRCKHTGKSAMNEEFMRRLLRLRIAYDKTMKITSGYRDKTHPIEASKGGKSGAHTTGRACDVAVLGGDALRLVELAIMYGFTGIGVQQKGEGRFIHLDDLENSPGRPRSWLWSYP